MNASTTAIGLALALAALTVGAQEPGAPPPADLGPHGQEARGAGGPGGERRHPIPPIMAALDLNGNGIIEAEEIAKAVDSLKTLDKNGDGKLTPDEIMPPRPHGGPGGEAHPQRPTEAQ